MASKPSQIEKMAGSVAICTERNGPYHGLEVNFPEHPLPPTLFDRIEKGINWQTP